MLHRITLPHPAFLPGHSGIQNYSNLGCEEFLRCAYASLREHTGGLRHSHLRNTLTYAPSIKMQSRFEPCSYVLTKLCARLNI